MNDHPELDVEFRPLVVPATVDAADAADFVEMTRVRNAERAPEEKEAQVTAQPSDRKTAARNSFHFYGSSAMPILTVLLRAKKLSFGGTRHRRRRRK